MKKRAISKLTGALILAMSVLFPPASFAQTAGSDLTSLPASALPVSPSRPPDPEWLVQCNEQVEPRRCVVAMNVFTAETGQLNLSIRIARRADSDEMQMQVRLPTDLFLPAGLNFRVDDHPAGQMGFITCSPAACFSAGLLNDDLFGDLKSGGILNLSYETAGRETITVPVTLIGFTAAVDQL